MPHYKVTLTKSETYYIIADNPDEAEQHAINIDLESEDGWMKKDYYDEITVERTF